MTNKKTKDEEECKEGFTLRGLVRLVFKNPAIMRRKKGTGRKCPNSLQIASNKLRTAMLKGL